MLQKYRGCNPPARFCGRTRELTVPNSNNPDESVPFGSVTAGLLDRFVEVTGAGKSKKVLPDSTPERVWIVKTFFINPVERPIGLEGEVLYWPVFQKETGQPLPNADSRLPYYSIDRPVRPQQLSGNCPEMNVFVPAFYEKKAFLALKGKIIFWQTFCLPKDQFWLQLTHQQQPTHPEQFKSTSTPTSHVRLLPSQRIANAPITCFLPSSKHPGPGNSRQRCPPADNALFVGRTGHRL